MWVIITKILIVIAIAALGCSHTTMPPEKLTGLWHKVEGEDTVAKVAKRYGSEERLLREINDLPSNGSLRGRAEIFVPKKGGEAPGTGAPPPRPLVYTSSSSSSPGKGNNGRRGKCQGATNCLVWPADGKVSALFGKRSNGHHDGLDIKGAKGAPIWAADEGKVLYSGDEIKGYGNLVIISHNRNIITVYAHNDENLVKEGDVVKRGQTIARMGNSGSASSTHLHFEVRDREEPSDPLDYLPRN